MKATKKIVGAACALVAAVALSAGSTFAWFSSNGTVSATGLEVAVSTNNAYLIIADTAANLTKGWKTISLENVGKVTTGVGEDAVTAPVELKPSAYKTVTTKLDENGEKTIDQITDPTTLNPADATCVEKVGNWYTAQGTSATNGTIETDKDGAVVKETLTDFGGYVIVTNMYVSVAGTVAVKDVNMTITDNAWTKATTETKSNDAISLLILYRTLDVDNTKEGAATTTNTNWKKKEVNAEGNHLLGADVDNNYLKVNDGDLNSSKYIEIQVMVYFDGNHTDVNTMNQANLTGIKLDFTFTDPSTASGS
ncbi:MAG: hypothetical protein K2I17_05085 [Clostridia bacterium]|nr:hypothetical protein [Clostridia bacterium]